MKKFKQIKFESDLEGKIITKVIMFGSELIIHFINDEFCIFKVDGYDETYIDIEDRDRPDNPTRYNVDDLKAQRFIDLSEFQDLKNKFTKEEEQAQEAKDRAQFEALKKKYGN